ncbi:unnamed protein product [Onchocerca flexuosa]|uniref:General transcription factor IIH subunit 3 n=1 Tax=Onchocerca flexuosa TaxID=387005 RepID=A0A183I0G0_9BILA|nr:unnamed protein product [Onchocerca flexuosa]
MTCLSIVIDCDARHWGELTEKENNEEMICTLINSITSYTTAHMSLSAANRIIIIGADSALSEPTIYATNASTDIDMSSAIKTAIRNALKKSASSTNTTESAVFAPAIAVAVCHIYRYKNEIDNGDGRILVINIGSDFIGEHNILMNIFFAAHKHNILIDVANIGETSPILQQASDITGGTYLNVKKPRQLLQYTMCFMLGKASLRSAFPSPSSSSSVDYRASCHCHGVPVSIGWVCSVCLSVQCHFSPICPACNTVFKISTLARRGRKKRREKN